ncbi:hypothetical protein J2854_004667 [Agrobacterium tumefaciens]|nr:hypothetical protein [Agrobacterium tumefaciens]
MSKARNSWSLAGLKFRRNMTALARYLLVAKVNTTQVRQFACPIGHLSKTDKINAFVLARLFQPQGTNALSSSSPALAELIDLVSRYRQL